MGGATGEAFVADIEKIGTFGDINWWSNKSR